MKDIVIIDQGSIFTKLAGNGKEITYLTRHAPASRSHQLGSIGYEDAIQIDNDETWYIFGDNLTAHGDLGRISNVTGSGRYYSDEYRRGIAYALFRMYSDQEPTKEGFEPLVVVSVPAEEFAQNKDAIEENILGKYRVRTLDSDGKQRTYRFKITLENLNVLPEGAGTFYDFVQCEAQGILQSNYGKETVVLASWGWYTLSFIIFDKGRHVSTLTLSNPHVGMQSVANAIFQRLGINNIDASLDEIDEMIRRGEIIYMGRKIDTEKTETIKSEEIAIIAKAGLDWLQSKIASSRLNVSSIIFTGGTSEMFWPYLDLENYPMRDRLPQNIVKVENAAREDCDGAWRYWDYMSKRNAQQA